MKKKYVIAVIGATGNVGREILNNLSSRMFPIEEVIVVASHKSVGKQVSFGDETLKVKQMNEIDFSKIDIAFFCAGSKVAEKYAKSAASKGCIVIDKSSFFRLHEDVPLIVPEANIAALSDFTSDTNEVKNELNQNRQKTISGIIASPNCCTIPLAVILKPLDNAAKIRRIIISTYQSV